MAITNCGCWACAELRRLGVREDGAPRYWKMEALATPEALATAIVDMSMYEQAREYIMALPRQDQQRIYEWMHHALGVRI